MAGLSSIRLQRADAVELQQLRSSAGEACRCCAAVRDDPAMLSVPESFLICTAVGQQHPVVWVLAADQRGFLFGLGRLLRELHISPGSVRLPPLDLHVVPKTQMRAHGLALPQDEANLSQFIKDLAAFGMNTISNAYAPAIAIAMQLGLDVQVGTSPCPWVAGAPEVSCLKGRVATWGGMKQLHHVTMAGGDDGTVVLSPPQHMATGKAFAAALHAHHPQAKFWLSLQEYSAANFTEFMSLLREPSVSTWLAGIFNGPHVRYPMETVFAKIPVNMSVLQYPDTCHPIKGQYPVPWMHWAYAFTYGRSSINPTPRQHSQIVRLHENERRLKGFFTYDEGINDDLNKAIWSAMSQDHSLSVETVVRQYARYHFGPGAENLWLRILMSLEQNWNGDLSTNPHVFSTLSSAQSVEASLSTVQLAKNWRLLMYLFRAYQDAYTRTRFLAEQNSEQAALLELAQAPHIGSDAAIGNARVELGRNFSADGAAGQLRKRVFELASLLNISASQPAHHTMGDMMVQHQNPHLGLDCLNVPLSNGAWLQEQLGTILTMSNETAKRVAITEIVQWSDPGPGGFYDNLGQVSTQPHLVLSSAATDPALYNTPMAAYAVPGHSGFNSSKPLIRMSWNFAAQGMYSSKLRLRYEGLDPNASYSMKVVYMAYLSEFSFGGGFPDITHRKVRCEASGETLSLVHDYVEKPFPMRPLAFPLPRAAANGSLELAFSQYYPDDVGECTSWTPKPHWCESGSGEGNTVAEVWVIKAKTDDAGAARAAPNRALRDAVAEAAPTAPAAAIVVDSATGDDKNAAAGCPEAKPCLTLDGGCEALCSRRQHQDTITVMNGTSWRGKPYHWLRSCPCDYSGTSWSNTTKVLDVKVIR